MKIRSVLHQNIGSQKVLICHRFNQSRTNLKSVFSGLCLICAMLASPTSYFAADNIKLCYDRVAGTYQVGALELCQKMQDGVIVTESLADVEKKVLKDATQGIFICEWRGQGGLRTYFLYELPETPENAKKQCADIGGDWRYSKKIPKE